MAASLARPSPRARRFEAACLCVALVALVGVGLAGGTVAAQGGSAGGATIENVTVAPDEGYAGVTETYTVTVETANASRADARVELDLTGWSAERTENVNVVTGKAREGPTNDSVRVKPKSGTVVVDLVLTHPTTAGDVPIEAALVKESGERIDSGTASIDVQSIDFRPSLGSSEIDAYGAEAEHTTELSGLGSAAPGNKVTISSPDLTDDELFEMLDGDQRDSVERKDGEIRVEPPGQNPGIELSARDFDAATYRFDLSPVRSEVETRLELEVVDPEIDGSFGTDRHEVAAGDMVTVDIELENADGAYLLVGADHKEREGRPTNYFDIVYVEGADNVTVNTRLLGTSADTEEIYQADGTVESYLHGDADGSTRLSEVRFRGEDGRRTWESLTAFRSEMGMSAQPWPLQPERYRFVLGADGTVELREDGIADFAYPIARSNLQLTEPGVESIETYVAPRGPANEPNSPSGPDSLDALLERATERETVAKEDRLVIEVNATGIYGALHYLSDGGVAGFGGGVHPEDAQKLLNKHEGVILEALQTDMDENEPRTELDLGGATDGEAYLLPDIDETNERVVDGRFYIVVDTRNAGAFDGTFSDGESDDFEFEYGYESPPEERYRFGNDALSATRPDPFDPASEPTDEGTEHYPYLNREETGTTETAPFTVAESYAEYDRTTTEGAVALSNGTNVTLTGETNVAPASEFYIQIVADDRSNPTRITIDDVNVTEDGSFEATRDLSALRVGEGVEVEFYAEDRLVDKRAGVVSGDRGTPSRFVIREAPERVELDPGERATVAATIENTGAATESKPVDLRVGEADVDSIRRTLAGGENRSVDLEAGSLEAGTYPYVLSTPDDEAVGRLVVGNGTDGGTNASESEGASETDGSGEDERNSETGGSDGGEANDGGGDGDAGDETDGDDAGDDPGLPSEFVGLLGAFAGAVGTEHAVGGAAVVGAAHVLGYWA